MREVLHLVVMCALVTAASAQVTPSQPEKVARTIAEVRGGNWARIGGLVKEAGPAQAVPILQELFASSQDVETKDRIASALYKLGDKNDIYWGYMVRQATLAAERDAPFPHSYDAGGKMEDGYPSDFIAWANAHNTSPQSSEKATWDGYGRILLLAMTEDPRAIPVLRQALHSPDQVIESGAAKGLAELQDKDSIPLIIEACRTAPADGAALIADSLVYFDDPRAQSAADAYLPKEKAEALREYVKAHGNRPFSSVVPPP
jgi:HEAT repeat protein